MLDRALQSLSALRLVLLLQVLGQGELRIFDEGETLLSRGFPHTQQVFILLRGHITMHLADGRTCMAGTHALHMLLTHSWCANHQSPRKESLGDRICLCRALRVALWCSEHRHHWMVHHGLKLRLGCAEPGAVLCSWPLLHTGSEFTQCVASTIVQAYSLPLHQLKARQPALCYLMDTLRPSYRSSHDVACRLGSLQFVRPHCLVVQSVGLCWITYVRRLRVHAGTHAQV